MLTRRVLLVILAVLLGALACGPFGGAEPTATPDSNVIATMVATQLQTEPPGQTEEPAATESPPPAEPTQVLPPCQPQPPPALNQPLPAGVAASIPESYVISLVDFNAVVAATKNAPGMTWPSTNVVHIAGDLSQGIDNLPIVYHSSEGQGVVKLNINNAISDVMGTVEFITLSGGPGTSALAYVRGESGPFSFLTHMYVAPYDTIVMTAPVLTRLESDGYMLFPYTVRVEAGSPVGVWYSLRPEGIGDFFSPDRGLYYLDLATSAVTEFLSMDHPFSAISPDQTWIAFRSASGAGEMVVRNLVTCQDVVLPMHPETNLGAGFAAISPDNQHVVWIEVSGPDQYEGVARLRVATTEGVIIADAPAANLYGLAGGEELTWITPRGWVDNNQFLVELSLQDWAQKLLVRVEKNFWNPILLTSGNFLGFYYP